MIETWSTLMPTGKDAICSEKEGSWQRKVEVRGKGTEMKRGPPPDII
jgi:hypothetical protein